MLNWRYLNVLPKTAWPIWLLTIGAIASGPVVSLIYYPALLRSGTLSSDGDTIAIPIFQTFIGAAILAPTALTITWLCLRYYKGGAKLTTWRHDMPARSTILSALFGVPALFLSGIAAYDYIVQNLPWREYLWLAAIVPQVLWLIVMRAVVVSQDKTEWLKAYNS